MLRFINPTQSHIPMFIPTPCYAHINTHTTAHPTPPMHAPIFMHAPVPILLLLTSREALRLTCCDPDRDAAGALSCLSNTPLPLLARSRPAGDSDGALSCFMGSTRLPNAAEAPDVDVVPEVSIRGPPSRKLKLGSWRYRA